MADKKTFFLDFKQENENMDEKHLEEYLSEIVNSSEPYEEFKKVPRKKKAVVFLELPKHLQKLFSKKMKISRIIKILKTVDPGDIVDFLELFTDRKKKRILKEFDSSLKKKVEYLLQFDPECAAGLMSLDYITIRSNSNFETIKKKINSFLKKNEKPPIVLVKSEDGMLRGHIAFTQFLFNEPRDLEKKIEEIPYVKYNDYYEDIIPRVKESEIDAIVVVDEEKQILGMIKTPNLIRIANNQGTKDVFKFAGVKKEEDMLDNAFSKFKSRYLWLILNLGSVFLAAFIVSLYEDTLSKLVLLAIYLPIIGGMGGNAATQTLAVVVRGIVTHEIDRKKRFRVLFHEVGAGLLNGIVNGILVAIIAYFWNGNAMLGLIICISMIINLVVAGFFGTLLPFVLDRLKIDPAIAATVFVTTATDIVGFFVFLSLAEGLLV